MKLTTTQEYLRWLLLDNARVELRHQDGRQWTTGWFDDLEALLKAARSRSRRGNLYSSLNCPKLRPVANAMSGEPLRDDDIAFVTRLVFDFDPARPAGIPSSQEELDAAGARTDAFTDMLNRLGWPPPLIALSGNGYHAQYRCRLRNSDETREMLQHLYQGLHQEFDRPEVAFDRKVRNPGRIFRLYGSINRKGPDTPERPHRKSTVIVPRRWQQVPPKLIEALASYYARQAAPPPRRPRTGRDPGVTGKGDLQTLDIVAYTAAAGLYLQHLQGHTHWIRCPWQSEHSTPSTRGDCVIFEAEDSWPGFYCHHSHCEGRGLMDLIAHLGGADAFCEREFERGAR